uniref:AlNc14C26G2529 protein n=1 Tax=Albugo laibachii Nc14 TaxID=890382 RepID=F0W6P1_9STRA|nr:AlNc14C26G2529 [Albugo laibachii Nc14]|eukprot:CCA16786.1 AlNc14C26G2529 [Albugo laibachii Nc14]
MSLMVQIEKRSSIVFHNTIILLKMYHAGSVNLAAGSYKIWKPFRQSYNFLGKRNKFEKAASRTFENNLYG